MSDPRVRIRAAVGAGAQRLALAGVPNPQVDAQLIVAHVLDVPRSRLAVPTESAERIAQSTDFEARVEQLISRRCTREPLQHILGTAPFAGLELAVGPGVFVPRPETETLVEWAVARLGERPPSATVVDLCTGSGALALAIAHHRPDARVYAVELDPNAFKWTKRNAAGSSVDVVFGDATDAAVLGDLDGRVDVVVSNPPYIPDAHRNLEPEVLEHDPHIALFAGPAGTDVVAGLVPRIAALLRPEGVVGIEHDDSNGDAVRALLGAESRFRDIAPLADLTGRERFATARRGPDDTSDRMGL